MSDLDKFYHSVRTTERKKHIRRVVWRGMEPDQKIKVYGPETVMFGDRPATAITSVAVKETADIYKHIDPQSSRMLQRDLYIDDITSGVDEKESIPRVKEKMTEILSKGNFFIKGFVCSYDAALETLALLGTGEIGRVLGMHWDATNDEFVVIAKINISKKFKGARSQPDLSYEEIPTLMNEKLTRRILLSIVKSVYDPIGLISPITVRLKIELRIFYKVEYNLEGDDPIPDQMKAVCVKLIQVLKAAEDVRFPRCIKPQNAVGNPELIMFNDGSKLAMCAAAYVRWLLDDGNYECRLWTAKTRVTPLHNTSVPRIEMQSAVMSVRLYRAIVNHSELTFDNKYFILDSMCTLALLQKDSMALKEYMGNRVSECLHLTQPENWFQVKSKDNIADLGTRNNAGIDDIVSGTVWQILSDWSRLPVKDWPVTQDVTGVKIPPEEMMNVNIVAAASIRS